MLGFLKRSSKTEALAPTPPDAISDDLSSPKTQKSWLDRLRKSLTKTSSRLNQVFTGTQINDNLFEELETALLMTDAGVEATQYLLEALQKKVRSEKLTNSEQIKQALHTLLVELLLPLEISSTFDRAKPLVIMVAGVNGVGKTTSLGKLAHFFQNQGRSILLAAGDTFRAAAREQLMAWGQRNQIEVISQEGAEPAAVIFDSVQAATARGTDIVIADTAGRLPTQKHLMQELSKIKRVLGKAMENAPHETWLVIDANTGQNALSQVKAFHEAIGLTGLIITKLDGTAKGGILAAIARQCPIPICFIGLGENVDDLRPFVAQEFVHTLLS